MIDKILTISSYFVLGVVVGAVVVFWLSNKKKMGLEKESNNLRIEIGRLKERIAHHDTQEDLAKKLTSKIWEIQENRFFERNETSLESILKPIKTTLQNYRTDISNQVDSIKKSNVKFGEKFMLFQQITNTMHEDAKKLTNALTMKSQTRGAWGESVLVEILQKWGLKENENYRLQVTKTGEDGQQLRPDVIIDLPDARHLVIDSKVSLNDWLEYVNSEGEVQKKAALQRHVSAVRSRVAELSGKQYQSELNSPDMVLMFVPIEEAFSEAIREDVNLLSNAFAKKIFVLGHTNLVLAIRLVEDIWRQHKQTQNVQEISNRGRLLYDQFVRFAKDIEKVGVHLDKTKESFMSAENRLVQGGGRSLISQAEQLVKLGVKSDQSLPKRYSGLESDED